MELAKAKNSQPLPILKSGSGLRLPPDRFCLTQPNYQLNFYKRAIASSSSQPATTAVRLPGSHGVFKTPAPRPIQGRGNKNKYDTNNKGKSEFCASPTAVPR